MFALILVRRCYGLTLNGPSWAHVLNTQSPAHGAVFKNSGLASGSGWLGIDLWKSCLFVSFLVVVKSTWKKKTHHNERSTLVLPIFTLSLHTSNNPHRTASQMWPEVCLLGNTKSCQVSKLQHHNLSLLLVQLLAFWSMPHEQLLLHLPAATTELLCPPHTFPAMLPHHDRFKSLQSQESE